MARSFYELYGITSLALCSNELSPTKYSNIIKVYSDQKIAEEHTFIEALQEFYCKRLTSDTRYLLIPCGDQYAKLVSKFQQELKNFFLFSTIPYTDYLILEEKATFYQKCDRHKLAYPNTIYLKPQNWREILETKQGQLEFPIILKASDSISYAAATIKKKKKAYKLNNLVALKEAIENIYSSSYCDILILQEFIPGDDSHMRVMNVYVDQNHQVRSMALGRPLLEDPSPESIGNYLAILPDKNDQLYQKIAQFLESIHYKGFANFDFKFDERDGTYKVFEMNLRQGRSSFFATLNGINLAQFITEDLILNLPFKKIVYNSQTTVWLGAPFTLVYRYVTDPDLKRVLRHSLYNFKVGTTLFYKRDISLKRIILQGYSFLRYPKKFRQYLEKSSKG